MKTEVIMERQILGGIVRQKSKSEFFNATDLIVIGNKWRVSNNYKMIKLSEWLRMKSVIEFKEQLEEQFGDVVKTQRGRSGNTWVHPYLFIDLALYISPKLKIEVYDWLYDSLLRYRNDSGDSYKKMTGALVLNCNNKSKFQEGLRNTAKIIQKACKVSNWQKATKEQLALRDTIHNNIALLCDVLQDNNQAVKIAIKKSIQL